MPRVAVLIPCYKRPEYTKKCIKALEEAQIYDQVMFYMIDDGSCDGTIDILRKANLNSYLVERKEPQGLRVAVIEFFDYVKEIGFDFISKVDNDCVVPKNWLKDILSVFEKNPSLGILSPNVFPSNAAFKYGLEDTKKLGYRPAKIVGGVWTMRADLVNEIMIDRFESRGITGAFSLLKQIIVEKRPQVGWLENVTFQDIGHWSGLHPEHIKTFDHEMYYHEVGRTVTW